MPSLLEEYNDPIKIINETKKVHTTEYFISLEQIPNEFHRVKIDNMTEVSDVDEITTSDFKVDYNTGKVFFHSSKGGQNITVKEYWGIGIFRLYSDRIATQIGDYGQAISTMYSDIEVINQMKDDYYNGIHFNVMTAEQASYTASYDGITYFQIPVGIWNPLTDFMDLRYDELTLIKDEHYEISGGQIVLLGWSLKQGDRIFFDVKKGVNSTEPITADGSQITNGTITLQKLAVDVQNKILYSNPIISSVEPSTHVTGRVWIKVL